MFSTQPGMKNMHLKSRFFWAISKRGSTVQVTYHFAEARLYLSFSPKSFAMSSLNDSSKCLLDARIKVRCPMLARFSRSPTSHSCWPVRYSKYLENQNRRICCRHAAAISVCLSVSLCVSRSMGVCASFLGHITTHNAHNTKHKAQRTMPTHNAQRTTHNAQRKAELMSRNKRLNLEHLPWPLSRAICSGDIPRSSYSLKSKLTLAYHEMQYKKVASPSHAPCTRICFLRRDPAPRQRRSKTMHQAHGDSYAWCRVHLSIAVHAVITARGNLC